MDIATVKEFFMWCTIINGGLFLFSSIFCIIAQDWVYQVQCKFYDMPRETFTVVLYSFMGLWKIQFITLNVVPYVALVILTR